MPRYRFECPNCGKQYIRHKRISNMDEPEFCTHYDGTTMNVHKMNRVFTAAFQIIGNPEKDKDENKLYKILTKGGGDKDQLELMRKDAERAERNAAIEEKNLGSQRYTPVSEIVGKMGLGEALQSGDVGIRNWREKNIEPVPMPMENTIA